MATILVIRNDDKFSSTLREAGFECRQSRIDRDQAARRSYRSCETSCRICENTMEYFLRAPSPPRSSSKCEMARMVFTVAFMRLAVVHGRSRVCRLNCKVRDAMRTRRRRCSPVWKTQNLRVDAIYSYAARKACERFLRDLKNLAAVDEVAVYKTEAPEIDEAKVNDLKSQIIERRDRFCLFFQPVGRREICRAFW